MRPSSVMVMSSDVQRRLAVALLAAVIGGGALSLWATIQFPTLDMFDSGGVWIGVGGGVLSGICAWFLLASSALPVRLALTPAGVAVGWWLCYGAAGVANGLLDRSETRWLSYTVVEHRHSGRASMVTLRRDGTDGPLWLRMRERRETVRLPIGALVVVPVRAGALDIAWRPGPVIPKTTAQ